jgi:hypothetical protein
MAAPASARLLGRDPSGNEAAGRQRLSGRPDRVRDPEDVAVIPELPDTPRGAIMVGKVRNGNLTHAETRHTFDLAEQEGRRFVLVLVGDEPGPIKQETLIGAIAELVAAVRALYGHDAGEQALMAAQLGATP